MLLVDGNALILRGNVHYRGHRDDLAAADSEQAMEVLKKIATSSRESDEAQQWQARALTLQGHVDIDRRQNQKAIDQLTDALRLYSRFPEAARCLGIAYINKGFESVKAERRPDEAQVDFKEAIKHLGSVVGKEYDAVSLLGRAHLGSAAAYELQNQHSEAAGACNEAVGHFRQVPEVHSLLPKLEGQCAAVAKQQ